ncbi:MAG: FAD-binding oxidoreductase [Raineya sp.]|nr:FAD-binding oxidoreductase [Raineya sp.]
MLSYWEKESFTKYDYIIVGSGIVGLSVAASLVEKKPTSKILILERGIFPSGASTKNAGFACFGKPTELLADIATIGEEATLELVEKRWKGLQALRKRIADKKMEFKQAGSYEIILEIPKNFEQKIDYLNKLLRPIFHEKVFHVAPQEQIQRFGFNTKLAKMLIYNGFEGQLHSGKLIQSLMEYVQKKKVKILNGCNVNQFRDTESGVEVQVNHEINFWAKRVAICNNGFIGQFFSHYPVKPGRGQVLVTKPLKKLLFKGNFHFDEGFYYFRNVGKNQILFGGGRNLDFEGETTTELKTTPNIINNLIEKLQTLIIPNQSFEIEQTWAGIMAFTPNRKPVIEYCTQNIVVGVALNGMGVAIGTTVAEEIANLLLQ